MVEILTPKPYIFMIRVTRQIRYIIAQAQSHPDHKYIWFRVGISGHIFLNRFPSRVGLSPGDKKC
jgi:hypothetical protein